jgi:transcription initiation factor TFIID TATA-box-binding protein
MVEPQDNNEQYNIEIVNVVASTGIGQEINLKQALLALEGADYDPKRFPGLVYRTKDPKTAALLFRSGKIVCTGAKSIDDVYRGMETYSKALEISASTSRERRRLRCKTSSRQQIFTQL